MCDNNVEPVMIHDLDVGDVAITSASLHPGFLQNTRVFAIGESGNYHGPKRAQKQKDGEEAETNWVRVFNVDSGDSSCHFKGHHGPLSSVQWFPDGQSLCSGSDDGTVRMYDFLFKI